MFYHFFTNRGRVPKKWQMTKMSYLGLHFLAVLKPVKGVGEPFYPEELQDIDGMDAVRESCRYKTSFDYIANYSME